MNRYHDADTKKLSPAIVKAVENSIEEDKGLFIYGNTGTGKTYTLYALAKNRGEVDNFVSMLVEYRDYMQKGCYFDRLTDMTRQKYLFIDDIGSEKLSDFVVEFLYLIVNKRYENMGRTVFSTNLSLEKFGERYGDRILSRISEMCVLVELQGNDRRI